MEIQILNKAENRIFRDILLFGLKESPTSFSDSFSEIQNLDENYFLQRLTVIGNPPETFVLGVFDPHLIGIVSFSRDQRLKARHKAFLNSMYILPEKRNQGIGTKLLNELLKRAKLLNGLEQIHVWVIHSDTSARNIYLRAGFESFGLVRKDLLINDEYVDSEYLVRSLK